MTKFLNPKMTFAGAGPKEQKKPHEHSTFGKILKGGKWYYLPCLCKIPK